MRPLAARVTPLAALAAVAGLHSTSLVSPCRAVPLATVRVAQGLEFPVYATSPASDFERLFIVEQRGVIKILKNGILLARPFLDIRNEVNSVAQEQGLLGLAFSPDYAVSGKFYVYFTTGSGAGSSVVRRFTRSADPDSADRGSSFPVLEVVQIASNHNGAHIDFGPDGLFYAGLGDGGGGGPASQDGNLLLGKMLRLDVEADDFPADPNRNYAIPEDNPFVGDPAIRDEIWALGLRNPYRWSFDRQTGDFLVADVGQLLWEELNFRPATHVGGENYGWPFMEGLHCYNPPTDCDDGSLTLPVHEYPHTPPGVCWSITGGYVYRGEAMPALRGTYFFGDFCLAKIWSGVVGSGGVLDLVERTAELDPVDANINNVAAFGQDARGEVYIIERSSVAGEVFKIVPAPGAVAAPQTAAPGDTGVAEPRFTLGPAHPNPSRAAVRFAIDAAPAVPLRASILDVRGRLVRRLDVSDVAPFGAHSILWNGLFADGSPAPAGVYFLRVEAGDGVRTQRFVRAD